MTSYPNMRNVNSVGELSRTLKNHFGYGDDKVICAFAREDIPNNTARVTSKGSVSSRNILSRTVTFWYSWV